MICYRDMQFCSRDCGNLKCERNRRAIDERHYRRHGSLPLSVGDMRTEECGYEPPKEGQPRAVGG